MSTIQDAEKALQALQNDPNWNSDDDDGSQSDDAEASLSNKKNRKQPSKRQPRRSKSTSCVLYIGHLPKHCQEKELQVLLSQFGRVERLRVSRSKKTLRSRGYAYCQLEDAEVAATVADTLSGYLLFGKRLVCHVVESDKVHKNLFFPRTTKRKTRKRSNSTTSIEKMQSITLRLVERERKKRQKLEQLGIDYTDFPGYEANVASEEMVEEKQMTKEKDTSPADGSATRKRKESMDSVGTTSSVDSSGKKKKKSNKEKKGKKDKKKRKDSDASSAQGTDADVADDKEERRASKRNKKQKTNERRSLGAAESTTRKASGKRRKST